MHVQFTTKIDAPADVTWQILGPEFARISQWANFVRTSISVAASEAPDSITVAANAPAPGRETKTKATLREFITHYDDDANTLTFEATGLPRFVERARNVQSVEAIGADVSQLIFSIDFDFKGPLEVLAPIVRKRMSDSLVSVMEDLKAEAERRHSKTT